MTPEDWFKKVVFVVLGFVFIAAVVSAYAKDNPYFTYLLLGSGVVGAIIYGAKKMFWD